MRVLSNLAITLVFAILIFVPTTDGQTVAYEVRSVNTNIELNLDSESVITQAIDLQNGDNDLTEIAFEIHLELSNLTIFVDSSLAASVVNYDDGISTVTIIPINTISAHSEFLIVINGFFRNNFQQVNHDEFQFFYDWDTNHLSNNITITVSMPPGAIISIDNGEYNIFPSNLIFSSDGSRIIAEWEGLSNAEGLNTRIFVQFSTKTRIVTDTNENSKILNIVLLIVLILVIGLLVYFVYLFRDTKNQVQSIDVEKTTKIVSSVKPLILSPSEIEILKIINEFEEGVAQSDLVKLLNISSARVSQNLAKFEDLGIIRKYKTGRQNIIIVDVDLDLQNFQKNKDKNSEGTP